ncbi:MAG: hypothetical protein R3F39_15140 [Myxococcota bacterium]
MAGRVSAAWVAFALALVMTFACESAPKAPAECIADCAGAACGSDGCGGVCGACAAGEACNDAGQCSVDCSQGCAALGLVCGTHCGEDCGACGADTQCVDHACVCKPQCAGKTCADDDGCGAACGPCARAESCPGCALNLKVVERAVADGFVRRVTVAVDYAPAAGAPRPGLVDLRFRVEGPGRLLRVGMGQPVLEARKSLLPDSETGREFQVLEGGVHRVIVMSPVSADRIASGRWLYLEFELGDEAGPASTPLIVSLLEREEIFAPAEADEVLWGPGLGDSVVVWANELP